MEHVKSLVMHAKHVSEVLEDGQKEPLDLIELLLNIEDSDLFDPQQIKQATELRRLIERPRLIIIYNSDVYRLRPKAKSKIIVRPDESPIKKGREHSDEDFTGSSDSEAGAWWEFNSNLLQNLKLLALHHLLK
jgi:hypothetical protein